MELQNKEISDKAFQLKTLEIKQKMIEKWNGQFPSTMLGNDINAIFYMGN